MDIYVARQPIYDASGEVRAYELLYRKNKHNAFEGIDDRQATASLIASSMLVMNFNELVDGKRGFINFSEEFLTDEIPKLFRPDKVVIEILERVHLTERVVNACQKLKASGYTLALDDFTFDSQIFTSGILKYID
ncbi:MAG: diguanylate phosphodiesterase, partial [Sporolactobacillus sp.]